MKAKTQQNSVENKSWNNQGIPIDTMLVASFSGARVVMDNKGGLKSIIESGLLAYRLVFPPTLLSCSSRLLRALQQNRAQSRLLYLLNVYLY